MLDKKDWRLIDQEDYLMDARLVKSEYKAIGDNSDHEHCAFCWDKFSESKDDLSVGYHTKDGRHWICEDCFNDFKEAFNFSFED